MSIAYIFRIPQKEDSIRKSLEGSYDHLTKVNKNDIAVRYIGVLKA